MKASKTANDFSKGSIPKAIIRMAVPITLAELVNVLYNIVDRMYIGHMKGEGAMALTGLGICMPVIMLVTAFSRLCGEGGAPFCAIERGRGDNDKAERILGNSFCLLVIAGLSLTALGLIFMKPLLYLFGADDETWVYAAPYCRIYLLGSVAVMISLGMNHYINAQGFARIGMMTVAIGAAMNIVLDPLFIFTFRMGVSGAALATILSQFVSAGWVLLFLTGKSATIKLRLRYIRLDRRMTGTILAMGVAGFVMSATNSVVQAAANRIVLDMGNRLYVGVMTLIFSVREVAFMPIQGLTSGARPVIGFNYGAGENGRVCEGIKTMSLYALIYNTAAWLVLLLLPAQLMSAFTDDAALIGLGVVPFRIYYLCYFMMAFQMAGQSSYTALGMSRQAIFFSLLRKVIIVVPLMFLLPHVFGLGVNGVFAAEPVSDVLGGVACYLTMYLTVYRRLKRGTAGIAKGDD